MCIAYNLGNNLSFTFIIIIHAGKVFESSPVECSEIMTCFSHLAGCKCVFSRSNGKNALFRLALAPHGKCVCVKSDVRVREMKESGVT